MSEGRRFSRARGLIAFLVGLISLSGLLLAQLTPASSATATTLDVSVPATNPQPGSASTVTVVARDSAGAVDATYRGRVHFTSTDPLATLPADFTFTSTDAGQHTFTATFNTPGTQTLQVTDTGASSITGSRTFSVRACDPALSSTSCPSPFCDPRFTTTASCPSTFCDPRFMTATSCPPISCDPRFTTSSCPSSFCDPRFTTTTSCPSTFCDPRFTTSSCLGRETIVVNPTVVTPGQQVGFSGSGFAPNTPLDVSLSNGTPLSSTSSDRFGNVQDITTVPASVPPGNYSLVVSDRIRAARASAPLNVTNTLLATQPILLQPVAAVPAATKAATVTRSGLPFTGLRENRLVAIGLALLFSGMLLLSGRSIAVPALGRRRQS